MSACTAFADGKCSNGFPVIPLCWGAVGFEVACPADNLCCKPRLKPYCQREEWAGRMYASNGGKPRPSPTDQVKP